METRTVYHIYTKIRGCWFDAEFPAKEYDRNITCQGAIDEATAIRIAGKRGRVWSKSITSTKVFEPDAQ